MTGYPKKTTQKWTEKGGYRIEGSLKSYSKIFLSYQALISQTLYNAVNKRKKFEETFIDCSNVEQSDFLI